MTDKATTFFRDWMLGGFLWALAGIALWVGVMPPATEKTMVIGAIMGMVLFGFGARLLRRAVRFGKRGG